MVSALGVHFITRQLNGCQTVCWFQHRLISVVDVIMVSIIPIQHTMPHFQFYAIFPAHLNIYDGQRNEKVFEINGNST